MSSSVSVSVARSQISSSSRPRRSWPTSSRWSPVDRRELDRVQALVPRRRAARPPRRRRPRAARGAPGGASRRARRARWPAASRRATARRPRRPRCGCRARAAPPPSSLDRERRPVVGRPADGDRAPAEVEPGRVAAAAAPETAGSADAAVERLADPHPELVAVGVVEPPDRGAVGARRAVACAVRPVGDLPVGVGGPVPGVDLPGAGGVRRVDAVIRGVPRPVGHRDARGREPAAPAVLDGGVGEQGVRDLRSRVLAAVRRRRGHDPNPARRCAAAAGWTGRWERMRTGGRDR